MTTMELGLMIPMLLLLAVLLASAVRPAHREEQPPLGARAAEAGRKAPKPLSDDGERCHRLPTAARSKDAA